MVQLKFVSSDGIPLGVINWYAVHGTSMNSTNCLVTSDNIGYASILFEKDINDGVPPGKASDSLEIVICFICASCDVLCERRNQFVMSVKRILFPCSNIDETRV